jgi:hypothetical protein
VIVVRQLKNRILMVFAAGLLLLAVGASTAFAQSPWWHLTSGTRPGNIDPGSERNDVQTVTVEATEGMFMLARISPEQAADGEFETESGEPLFVFLPYNASHELVQSELEKLYGTGNLEVSGDGKPYEIKFKNELSQQPVEAINAEVQPLLEGGKVSVKHVVVGKPAGEIYLTAEDVGDGPVDMASPTEIADKLPPGLRAVAINAYRPYNSRSWNVKFPLSCKLASLTCTMEEEPHQEPVKPFYPLEVRILVDTEPGASTGELNEARISGGGALSVSVKRPIRVSSAPTPFGVEEYELNPEEEGGAPATQAGVHPFQLTTTIALNQGADTNPVGRIHGFGPTGNIISGPNVFPVDLTKDLNVKLPAGLVGNATVIPQCTETQFSENISEVENGCPARSAIGVAVVTVNEPSAFHVITQTEPVFNMVPRVGEPARFAFHVPIVNIPVYLDTSVRTGSDYGVTVNVDNVTQLTAFLSSEVTIWGTPSDPRHNSARGWGCLLEASKYEPRAACEVSEATHPTPFLQMPTSCEGLLQSSVESDSWEAPTPEGQQLSRSSEPLFEPDGCNRLPFRPSLKVTPDGTAGSTPTGLTVDVHNPQEGSLNETGVAEPDVRNITVALPEGVSINPAGADGLEACSMSDVGYLPGVSDPPETLHFTGSLAQPFCSDASKIGTVTIRTPLLPNAIEGAVYLAAQNENPFHSLVAMYLVAHDPVSGVLIKLAGVVHLSETGHIVATFANNPQLPFEDAELHFFGGERAPLATPAHCGAYTTTASFSPWTGTEAATPSTTFDINSGPNGTPCPGSSLPFSPSLTAGTTSNQAGGFSPFTMTMSREDGNQNLQSIQLHMPSGLEGVLSSVALCGEEQANAGTCGAESQIGETTVSVGLGGDPFSVKGGKVYITGPYDGAPFGLSIVNPAVAGPFNLGNVVVRAKIEVDPRTAELTITSDASGPYAIPTILDGIPLEIKHVNVTINRPGFTFNPTSCEKTEIGGNLSSAEGATQTLAVSFQPTNCAVLKFTPSLSVKTAAYASKAKGTSLQFKIAYPKGAMGTQSWFNEAKFDIPKQLPARLSTIQQACTATTFETNRVACPKHSIIGSAVVHTPILPVPLEGPVYFVSYGGAKFPDAVLVLKGYGLTIELHGNTFINGSTGVTSATFKALPDVPFESIEVNLPAGEYSEFGANLPAKAHFDFCGQKLTMPTFFKASNGAQIKQNTTVAISGCPKATKKKTKKKHKAKGRKTAHKSTHTK